MGAPLVLMSHVLCPYVQRAAIVLAAKGVPFERHDIDLASKPNWFLKVSPLGKTPVLLVGDKAIFESAVICEYLEETALPRLHPANALLRAQHRSWMGLGSALLNLIGEFYDAADETALVARAAAIRAHLAQIEVALGEVPFLASESVQHGRRCLRAGVSILRCLRHDRRLWFLGRFAERAALERWRRALATRPSVAGAVHSDYPDRRGRFLLARRSALSQRMTQLEASA